MFNSFVGSDKLFGYVALSLSALAQASKEGGKEGGKMKLKITDNSGTHIHRKAHLTLWTEGRATVRALQLLLSLPT